MVSRVNNSIPLRIVRRTAKVLLPGAVWVWNKYATLGIKIQEDSETHGAMRDKLAKALELNGKDKVLDAGCGTAVWSIAMLEGKYGSPVSTVWAVDSSPGMIRQAEKNKAKLGGEIQSRLNIREANLSSLHSLILDRSITKIWCLSVWTFLGEKEKVDTMNEFSRMLEPGGRVSIATFRKRETTWRYLQSYRDLFKEENRLRKEKGAKSIFREDLRKIGLLLGNTFFTFLIMLKLIGEEWEVDSKEKIITLAKEAGLEFRGPEILTYGKEGNETAFILTFEKSRNLEELGRLLSEIS